MIEIKDIIKANVTVSNKDYKNSLKIAKNTINTWQVNRNIKIKVQDTLIGKLCEKAFLLKINHNQNLFSIIDYDSIREDNFKCHAPLDFVLISENKNKQIIVDFLKKKSISKNSSKLTQKDMHFIKTHGGATCELKSTRITNRHLFTSEEEKNINLKKILHDDFLTYPLYIRKSNFIYNFKTYLNYCIENQFVKNKQELFKKEQNNMLDFYFRAYIYKNNKNNYEVFLIGGIDKKTFIQNMNIKKMILKNKSENAVYFATKLKNGLPLDEICERLNNYIITNTHVNSKIKKTP